MEPRPKPSRCPTCGSQAVARIVYGRPASDDNELIAAIDRGEIVLGGCYVNNLSPALKCHRCGERWRIYSVRT